MTGRLLFKNKLQVGGLLLFCLIITYSSNICGQTTIFSETFDEAVGSTSGTSAEGINWTATCPGCLTGDYHEIRGGALEGGDTNGPAVFTTGNIDVSNCNRLELSLAYIFSESFITGGMELPSECHPLPGDPCPGDPSTPTFGDCNTCWDFLWIRLLVDGVEIASDLIGEDGTLDSEQMNFNFSISGCVDGGSVAVIEITHQTWAAAEQIAIDNVVLTCFGGADINAVNDTIEVCEGESIVLEELLGDPAANDTWSWTGPAGSSNMQIWTISPSTTADAGQYIVTVTDSSAAMCMAMDTVEVVVNPATDPTFNPIDTLCENDANILLQTTSNEGITGTWSGTGVTGGGLFFDPSVLTQTIYFTPDPSFCAALDSIEIIVEEEVRPTFDADSLTFCTNEGIVSLPTTSNEGFTGTWIGAPITGGNQYNTAFGTQLIIFSPDAQFCSQFQGFLIQVDPLIDPVFNLIPTLCINSGIYPLQTISNAPSFIVGSWSGPGVTSNLFDPSVTGIGTFRVYFTPADPDECAATDSIDIVVDPLGILDTVAVICEGETFNINGVDYVRDTILSDTFPNGMSCDSVVNLNLTVLDYQRETIDTTICAGEQITVNGIAYTSDANIIDTFSAPIGCDSIVTLNLIVEDYQRRDIDTVLCPGESITVNGTVYSTVTNTNDTFPAPMGCDSLVSIMITFDDYQRRDIDTTLCPRESITVNGVVYNSDTNISDTFPAPMGCDSIVNIMITTEDYQRRDLNATLCPGESVTVNGVVYNSDTNISDTFPAPMGCDSIVNIMITTEDYQR
ncbi:MAG: hypothetical protein AAGK97_01855, partial [Bacteroidota bacterium]